MSESLVEDAPQPDPFQLVVELGIEGIEVTDNAVQREGTTVFGALGVGGLKMKIHKACIARLFERNDQVLDAETIAEVAAEVQK